MISPIVFGGANVCLIVLSFLVVYRGWCAHRTREKATLFHGFHGEFFSSVDKHKTSAGWFLGFLWLVAITLPLLIEPSLRAEKTNQAPHFLLITHFWLIAALLLVASSLYFKITGWKHKKVHGILGWTCAVIAAMIVITGNFLYYWEFVHR